MKSCTLILLLLCGLAIARAQHTTVLSDDIRTFRVVTNGNPLLPPIVTLGGRNSIEFSFDELTHEYHRYIYRITHCDAYWQPSQEVFESDYLSGFNNRPIEDYEESFNTSVLYTHYSFTIPNNDVRVLLSGNYLVSVYNDEGDEPELVAQTGFCVTEGGVSIGATASSNTDVDFNKAHQQLELSISYGALRVTNPTAELHTVVMQNRTPYNTRTTLRPNIIAHGKMEYTHNADLIFEAGNEYRKFEVLNLHVPTLNIDYISWHDPYTHATLLADEPARNYIYDEDQNGAYVIRNNQYDNTDITSDYVITHFTLSSPPLPSGQLYVCGQWSGYNLTDAYRMEYDIQRKAYTAALLLKQGYYNYQYVQVSDDGSQVSTQRTHGNFYQTENEYIILVYYRPIGSRYDRLVGYRKLSFSAY